MAPFGHDSPISGCEALTVTLWEDDIAWTSYRAPL